MSPEYLAGFFDGEGTFIVANHIKKSTGVSYPAAKVMLSQSGEDGLALLEAVMDQHGGQLYHHLKVGQHKATKNAYKIYWKRKEAIALINVLLPHLILKKQAAQTVLAYLTRKDND